MIRGSLKIMILEEYVYHLSFFVTNGFLGFWLKSGGMKVGPNADTPVAPSLAGTAILK